MTVSRKEGNRRLLLLADFLDRLPPKRFDFSVFVGLDWRGKADLSCGTTACALGWATTIPLFRKVGLRLKPGYVSTVRNGSYQDAARLAFGISPEETELLFVPKNSVCNCSSCAVAGKLPEEATAKMVARRLRKFVRDRQ